MRQVSAREPNVRIVTVDTRLNFEELVAIVLRQAIGDHIVAVLPGEIGRADLLRMVTLMAQGQYDVVRAVFPVAEIPLVERVFAWLIQALIRLATGYRIQGFQARAFALSRNAVSRLQTSSTTLKFFRILDLTGAVSQTAITIDRPRRRNLFADIVDRFRLATELVSRSSARLIRTLAVTCMILSVTSLGATVFSLLVWLVKSDVAPGWTSLTMISSFLFAANFGVLSAICLGILLLIRRSEPDDRDSSVTEISGGDLFLRDERLNVETGESDA